MSRRGDGRVSDWIVQEDLGQCGEIGVMEKKEDKQNSGNYRGLQLMSQKQ